MFAVMLDTEYMTKPKFKENFISDWKKILGNKHIIQNLEDCDFTSIYEWHQREKEKKKQMSTDVSSLESADQYKDLTYLNKVLLLSSNGLRNLL